MQICEKLGFSCFLLPREFSDLQRAAQTGPIVILNASKYRCDAFIILSQARSPHVVPLGCSLEILRTCQAKFRRAVQGVRSRQQRLGSSGSSRKASFASRPYLGLFKRTLQFLWKSVVEPCWETLVKSRDSVSNLCLSFSISILFTLHSIRTILFLTQIRSCYACDGVLLALSVFCPFMQPLSSITEARSCLACPMWWFRPIFLL